jgi:uncharacterized protein
MISLDDVEGFEWDSGNSLKSETKHGVTRAEVEQVFLADRLLVVRDERHSGSESRYHALGRSDAGHWLHVSFTLRGRRLRVISARAMNRKERKRYDEHT